MRKSIIGAAIAAAGRKIAHLAASAGRAGEGYNLAPGLMAQYALGDERVAATRRYLEFVILPLWFVSGVADYICHRRSKIETTSGVTESAIHSLMMVEGGLPAVAGLVLEANAGVISMALAAFVAHQATAIWDIAYAVKRRAGDRE